MGLCLHGNRSPPTPCSLEEQGTADMGLPGLAEAPSTPCSLSDGTRPLTNSLPPVPGGEQMASLGVLLRLLPSISGSFCLSVTASLPLGCVVRGACSACACLTRVHVDTRVVPLANPCLKQAHPTLPSVPISPWFLLYLLKKKKVEMCRVRKTCSIFLKGEKTGTRNRPEG